MDTSKTLTLAGRILLALPMVAFGFGHFTKADEMQMMVPQWLPGGVFWVYFTGVALVAGAVGIASGYMGKYAALGTAAMMIVFVLTLHAPNMMSDNPMLQQFGFMGTMKDTMIAGGALGYAAHFWKS